jgi:FMN-dependent NADH-azoreductase
VTILRIDSSISGPNSVSQKLTDTIASQLAGPGDRIVHRDLAADPLDHLTARGQDEHLLDEFIAADTVVIGAPMYNFTIPTQLKAWLDRLAVAGKSFRYTEAGPEGMLKGKRVIIALASGGHYADDSPFEHSKSYLTAFFNFLGIEPEFVGASGIALGAADAIANAEAQIHALAA